VLAANLELCDVSSKFLEVISTAQARFDAADPDSKIVVLSSCPGTLLWLNVAFLGLQIPVTLCQTWDQRTTPTLINRFLASPTRVLVIAIDAIQANISLPPDSTVIVTEAIVSDIQLHLSQCFSTNSPNKMMLVAQGTVEELIAVEPLTVHRYNSFDENGTFIGPVFNDVERMIHILQCI
jgi:hypothetical protein